MDPLYIKALHLIFVITWFAGLFYIVRLFIYHTEANEKPEPQRQILQDQFKIMERRLWYGITWPSAILVLIFGGTLLRDFIPIGDHPWLKIKLTFVFFLYIYHYFCGHLLSEIHKGKFRFNSFQLRIWNEVATIFLVSIVFLAVVKELLAMGYGLLGLILFAGLLMAAIKVYKNTRSKP